MYTEQFGGLAEGKPIGIRMSEHEFLKEK